MLNKITFYQLFIVTVIISPVLGYFSNSGIIAYGPIILLLFFISLLELIYSSSMKRKDWIAIFVWMPYVTWAGLYYISNPYEGRYLTTHLLVIIGLPFFVLSFLKLRNSTSINYTKFIYKIIIFSLISQLVICLGQISTYILGFGFPVSEEQASDFMVAGTFTNANDLGGVVLLLSFVFIGIEKNLAVKNMYVWLIIVVLLIISGSRSALLLTFILFIITRGLKAKNILLYSAFALGVYTVLGVLLIESNIGVLSRFTQRLDSLSDVLKGGIDNDGSITLRMDSYLYFINNIGSLGLGSGKLEDYYKYATNANFDTYLIFQNPHSLLVEVGYWLGYPGLLSLLLAMFYLSRYSDKKLLLFVVLSVSTLIPSSVIGSLIYFIFMICAFFPPLLLENQNLNQY